jgi:hypothetical protein
MGVEYWYYYQESGGKSAAARWFQLALATDGAQQADWYASASIHADIGSYYEKLGQIEDEDRRRDALCTYWDDLRQLWQMAESETMQVQVRMQIGTEMCSCLLMGAAEIAGSGESQDTLLQILDEVQTWADMLQTEQETQQETDLLEEGIQEQNLQKQKDEMNDVCFAARMAVERVFADERGMAFETETAAE